MPFTVYHFGHSGFIGLVFRKWLDVVVFVLANVIVDVEVLVIGMFDMGRPIHRYCHTLLIGGIVGALWGLAAYPLRGFFGKIMRLLRVPYQTNLLKMTVSGILGVWLHVVIDGIYHWDVRILWPSKNRELYRYWGLDKGDIENICIAFIIAAIIAYVVTVIFFCKQNRPKRAESEHTKG